MPKLRTTLSLDASVVAQFKRIAELEGSSLSAVVNDWLSEVADSASLVAQAASDQRAANALRLRHAIAHASGSAQAQAFIAKAKGGAAGHGTDGPPPRLVIRGGNSPAKGGRRAA